MSELAGDPASASDLQGIDNQDPKKGVTKDDRLQAALQPLDEAFRRLRVALSVSEVEVLGERGVKLIVGGTHIEASESV